MVAPAKAKRSNTPRKPVTSTSARKTPAKPNASILSFFQKADRPETSLFIGSGGVPVATTTASVHDLFSRDEESRFNEVESPVKKRRISEEPEIKVNAEEEIPAQSPGSATANDPASKRRKSKARGPFVMDSDSEDEEDEEDGDGAGDTSFIRKVGKGVGEAPKKDELSSTVPIKNEPESTNEEKKSSYLPLEESATLSKPIPIPELKHEECSRPPVEDDEQPPGFGDEEIDLDDFEGEEAREMRFLREQARLEAEEAGIHHEDAFENPFDESAITACPICSGSLEGADSDEATRHVNSCLDGNPTPLPNKPKQEKDVTPPDKAKCSTPEVESAEVSKRFARTAVPRPGQANPLELANGNTKFSLSSSTSAFSKLMSNNAEDTAWANAASAAKAERGRPAYERTCPFYKIMPGFSICVDAFRYGAIAGCQAYFLSHFHSDHYIGLTSSWRHGPIYCSKVTGSLVRQQLRTADKWVVELEYEKPYDIPNTDGASVIMIPANHCPGSSLFLFLKKFGDGPRAHTKRILHCGDFRACPAHVNHPLLMPNTVDTLTGKLKQQKIDYCYLDTTYLNPRYSFPPQSDVINACADLMANMSPDPDCEDDIWNRSAKELATPSVAQFYSKVKDEAKAADEKKKKPRQRLLVICGTYSIGKERICVAIAKALESKIFASPQKIRICKQLGDPELSALLTSNPLDAQVHMQMLMEIRAETLQEYLNGYKPHYSRIVGFRPSGWTFRPAEGKAVGANTPPGSIPTQQILHGKGWRTRFGHKDLIAQRGSTREAMCFGVPYSEHSSFRELAMFVMSLRIDKIVPTVNVGSDASRQRMKAWLDRWTSERNKGGFLKPLVEGEDEGKEVELWEGKSGKGGGAWW